MKKIIFDEKLKRHYQFWNKEEMKRPLIGFRVGSDYPTEDFKEAQALGKYDGAITPDMIEVRAFLEDYEELYKKHAQVDEDSFWVATPFPGFPWMEAIMGCEIRGLGNNFWAKSFLRTLEKVKNVKFLPTDPWFQKLLEFTKALVNHSRSRYPVGQPILRGPTDIMGALRGQSQLVYDLYDSPSQIERCMRIITDVFVQVVKTLQDMIPEFHGGHSIGFWDLWTPENCIWFQEDISALLSPTLYRRFFLSSGIKISSTYNYSLLHLHPSSLSILNEVLKISQLTTVEINRDVKGEIERLIPAFRKVLKQKRLLIWGKLDYEETKEILTLLPFHGLYLHIIVSSVEEANDLMRRIDNLVERKIH